MKFEPHMSIGVCLPDFYHGKNVTTSLPENLYFPMCFEKCFVESTLSLTEVFEWHIAFSESCEVIENLSDANPPFNSVNNDNIERVKETVFESRRIGIKEIDKDPNIS